MAILQSLVGFHGRVATALQLTIKPSRHWLVVYAVLLVYFLVYRCVSLSPMLRMFGTPSERTRANRFYAVVLGAAEDFLLVTLLLVLLSLVDLAVGPRATTQREWLRRSARVVLHTLLVVLTVVSFAADMLLIRSRELRFTFEFITTYFREFKFTAGFEVDPREVQIAQETVVVTVVVVVALIAMTMLWLDLSQWHLAKLFKDNENETTSEETIAEVENGKRPTDSWGDTDSPRAVDTPVPGDTAVAYEAIHSPETDKASGSNTLPQRSTWVRLVRNTGIPLVLLTALSMILLVITHAVPAVVSATALNDSLNELFRVTIDLQFLKSLGDGTIESAAVYLDATESYELFKEDVLLRKTTGFQGPLAFDVDVDQANLPNVVVIAVESFRFQDSLYLVGNTSAAIQKKQGNMTLTPQFDHWAQRGIAFRNLWSSWQTSRSVEGILFAQVPYDHVSDSGTTTGRRTVALNGMPQFFHAKGFETAFTTGARLNYDGWNKFFKPHGFDEVVGASDMRTYAEAHYNISENDWKPASEGGQGRSLYWGVHDDVSFDFLGDLMLNKTAAQRDRVAKGAPKTPFFINHYTISSHTPWEEHPAWFDSVALPDFTPLLEGFEDTYQYSGGSVDSVRHYAKMRYFTDMQLGKFLDRMKKEGVLNDTIVVITGDHGQSPESRATRPYADETTTTRVAAALVAEGRLAKYAGLVLDDAAAHYDLLNTLADIVGVPSDGFLQSGVGRSLKRSVPFGERPVWSNNPMHQMAVVKGHKRMSFDRVFSRVGLYDVETDPMERDDLLPRLNNHERTQWATLREQSRRLSRYFRKRWDRKCISKVEC